MKLAPEHGLSLKPGMTSRIDLIIAEYHDVLTVRPIAAVLELADSCACYRSRHHDGPQRRTLDLSDTNDQFIVVNAGPNAGDEVILNPVTRSRKLARNRWKPVAAEEGPEARTKNLRTPARTASRGNARDTASTTPLTTDSFSG